MFISASDTRLSPVYFSNTLLIPTEFALLSEDNLSTVADLLFGDERLDIKISQYL